MAIPTLTLLLPPSVNKAYWHNHDKHQTFYGKEAKQWFIDAQIEYMLWHSKNKISGIIDDYTYCDLDFWLPRRNCDCHNYLKVLFDGLEKFGLVKDDKFLLSRIQNVYFDSKNPRVSMQFSLYQKQVE